MKKACLKYNSTHNINRCFLQKIPETPSTGVLDKLLVTVIQHKSLLFREDEISQSTKKYISYTLLFRALLALCREKA